MNPAATFFLKHGSWLPWVEKNLPFDDSQARRYLSVFNRRDEISNRESTHDLTFTDAYKLLSDGGGRELQVEKSVQ